MGLLDALFGRKKLPPSKTATLGSISSAELTLRTELGAEPSGKGGLAMKTLAASGFERAREDVRQMIRLASEDLGARVAVTSDEYGYTWLVVEDEDFPDVVAIAQMTADAVTEEGFGDRLLCAVFPFRDAGGGPLYIVYAFKRGSFYAFAPREGQQRDLQLELRTHALLEGEVPLERDLEYRYPLWGVPL